MKREGKKTLRLGKSSSDGSEGRGGDGDVAGPTVPASSASPPCPLPMSPPLPKFVTTARQMASAALTGAAASEARDDKRVDGSVPSGGVLPPESPVPRKAHGRRLLLLRP
jgi:hypothetical protein